MNKIIFKFIVNTEALGNKYESQYEFEFNNKKYIAYISIQQIHSLNKIHTRIMKIEKKINNEWIKIEKFSEVLKILNNFLLEKIFNIECQAINKFINNKNSNFNFSYFHIYPDEKYSIFTNKISDDIIQNLLKSDNWIEKLSNYGDEKLFISSTLNRLKKINNKWKNLIYIEEKEHEFQKLLKNYEDLFLFIFPKINASSKNEFEYFIINENEKNLSNKIDIFSNNNVKNQNTIIELKKPSTKLFTKNNSRNNIFGISTELASTAVQLSLYNKRIQMNSKSISESFTQAILIVGLDNSLKKYEKNAFELFKENFSHNILTFNDIYERVDNIIEFIENQKNKNNIL